MTLSCMVRFSYGNDNGTANPRYSRFGVSLFSQRENDRMAGQAVATGKQ
ncbi:hypothetical protein NB643_06310 [Oxalobacter aliiformigenes]|nr:hypothetical protein [Oxalobacter aliiformigenes]WAV94048.1 hypothetical protein NB641_04815 [Oxalobacter aliiformigenes]WAV94454.1 hypothetical protein NB643_06310 [Oxalobacter aliiformigenes]WAV97741.1 hypothetical protein NB645_03135 [Oxalobacter aliiformigenes]